MICPRQPAVMGEMPLLVVRHCIHHVMYLLLLLIRYICYLSLCTPSIPIHTLKQNSTQFEIYVVVLQVRNTTVFCSPNHRFSYTALEQNHCSSTDDVLITTCMNRQLASGYTLTPKHFHTATVINSPVTSSNIRLMKWLHLK